MPDIVELTEQQTLKLPYHIAARFRPSDRFVIWADGDTLHLKRITPPSVTQIVEQAPEGEPLSMDEISAIIHQVRRRRKSG
jgi:hypothetical protein